MVSYTSHKMLALLVIVYCKDLKVGRFKIFRYKNRLTQFQVKGKPTVFLGCNVGAQIKFAFIFGVYCEPSGHKG